MQEARNRILLLENSLDEEQQGRAGLSKAHGNDGYKQKIYRTSDEDKLSRLREYIRELKSCMQGD